MTIDIKFTDREGKPVVFHDLGKDKVSVRIEDDSGQTLAETDLSKENLIKAATMLRN